MNRAFVIAICFMGACLAQPSAAGWQELPVKPGGAVSEVIDGDTVILTNGDEVRFVGIQAPKLPLGRKGFRKWPLADEARETLRTLVRGRTFDVRIGETGMDRHGRVLAHLVSTEGIWLQGEMLRLGMARVYSFPDNTALVGEMLRIERRARAARFGIWSHPFYAIRSPDELGGLIGTFQIVEGSVQEAADARGTIYLNFGEDWRTDFTVAIDRRARSRFTDPDPIDLEGKHIRVRGWIRSRNGPLIQVTHPEQIEITEEEK